VYVEPEKFSAQVARFNPRWRKLEERLGDATKDFNADCMDKQRRPILRLAAMQNGAMNTEPVAPA
jgi:hypothetical protein